MPYSCEEAKRVMLAECRKHLMYYDNCFQLDKIAEFGRLYHPANAIYWYTKSSFLHTVVNEALRTEDPRALYIYRFFIIDLCNRLEEDTVFIRERFRSPFCVYRGSSICRDEVEKLRIGTLVGTNGFFSCSLCVEVAKMFGGVDPISGMSKSRSRVDKRQFILFEIVVDFLQTSELIVADISKYSVYEDEKEILFGLGTTFIVNEIKYDTEHYLWHIRMSPSSEMAALKQKYTKYIHDCLNQFDATILFGTFLAEMSSDYPSAMSYFQRQLRIKPFDDPCRWMIYYHLGRVYRCMGKCQEAIEYIRRAMLLQRHFFKLPNYQYGYMLSHLALAYSELNDTTKAIKSHGQVVDVFSRFLGPKHEQMAVYYARLAEAYYLDKQYERAHALLLYALSILDEKPPSNFIGRELVKYTMGLVKCAIGQLKEALDCLDEALQGRRKLLADDHPLVARTYHAMAVVYITKGDEQTALKHALMALAIRQAKLSKNHAELKESIELVDRLNLSQEAHTLSATL